MFEKKHLQCRVVRWHWHWNSTQAFSVSVMELFKTSFQKQALHKDPRLEKYCRLKEPWTSQHLVRKRDLKSDNLTVISYGLPKPIHIFHASVEAPLIVDFCSLEVQLRQIFSYSCSLVASRKSLMMAELELLAGQRWKEHPIYNRENSNSLMDHC